MVARNRHFTRRHFILGTTGIVGLGVLTACGAAPSPSPTSGTGPTATGTTSATASTSQDGSPTNTAVSSPTAHSGAKTGGSLVIAQDFGPQELDPTKTNAWASINILEVLYTGLLRWSPSMEIEPDLATKYEAIDSETYEFNLRGDVRFHNGDLFSSDDVRFTIERMLDPATASPYRSIFNAISSVEPVDPKTVRFNLSEPFAPLLRYLATIPYGAIVPKSMTSDISKTPVGTGAFKFEKFELDQVISMTRFADYYEEGLPYLDRVEFKILGDDTSISSALKSKTIDMAWFKDPKVADNIAKTTPGAESTPGVSSRYITAFLNLASPPFDDVRVRRALSLSLDRTAIVETVLGEYGKVGTFLPSSQLAGYKGDGADLPYYTQDIDQAKRLLKEAGYDELNIPEFQVVAANALDVQCAQVIKQQAAAAGINITINAEEVGLALKNWNSGDYTMLLMGDVWQPDPDAQAQRYNSQNVIGKAMKINDPELDRLVGAARSEMDEEKRVDLYHQIQKRVLDQVYVVIPYQYPLRWEIVWDYVKGYEPLPSNSRITLRKTWLDK